MLRCVVFGLVVMAIAGCSTKVTLYDPIAKSAYDVQKVSVEYASTTVPVSATLPQNLEAQVKRAIAEKGQATKGRPATALTVTIDYARFASLDERMHAGPLTGRDQLIVRAALRDLATDAPIGEFKIDRSLNPGRLGLLTYALYDPEGNAARAVANAVAEALYGDGS